MVLWILWFVIGNALVAVFSCFVLPRIYKRAFSATNPVRDRALGKYNIRGGVAILYEPALSAKKYLKKYQVYQLDKKRAKFFVGEWEKTFTEVEYSLFVFERHNALVKCIKAKKRDDPQILELPEETDYVSVRFHSVDGRRLLRERRTSLVSMGLYTFFFASLAAAADTLLWLWVSFVFRCIGGDGGLAALDWIRILVPLDVCLIFLPLLLQLPFFLRDRFDIHIGEARFCKTSKMHACNVVQKLCVLLGEGCEKLRYMISKGSCALRNLLYRGKR